MENLQIQLCLALALAVSCIKAQWNQADLTNYDSYPDCCTDPNADQTECDDDKGCDYQGMFAFVDGQQSKSWVENHNIISVLEKDADTYKLKTFEIKQGDNTITATVYDECNDSDCGGCCTQNSQNTGFLIDMEHFTMQKFGSGDGVVQWRCIDCDTSGSSDSTTESTQDSSTDSTTEISGST